MDRTRVVDRGSSYRWRRKVIYIVIAGLSVISTMLLYFADAFTYFFPDNSSHKEELAYDEILHNHSNSAIFFPHIKDNNNMDYDAERSFGGQTLNQPVGPATTTTTKTYKRQKFESFTSQLQRYISMQRTTNQHADVNNITTLESIIQTRFSEHVQQLVHLRRSNDLQRCRIKVYLNVSSSSSYPPSFHQNNLQGRQQTIVTVTRNNYTAYQSRIKAYIRILQSVFTSMDRNNNRVTNRRSLPGNVTIGISPADYINMEGVKKQYGCYGSSAPGGIFTITNFLEAARMVKNITYTIKPWEDRESVPIWRGSPWAIKLTTQRTYARIVDCNNSTSVNKLTNLLERTIQNKTKTKRLSAVLFSRSYPDLLDAKFSSKRGLFSDEEWEVCWKNNATNGLHKVLPFHQIPDYIYYSNYQVALVLGGHGAAFRTGVHLSTGTAVLLADYQFEEWFTRFMIPFVHYIPLQSDLGNLHQRLLWIRNNPTKVKEIGRNGKEFYDDYLSKEASEEFYYELLYKLALLPQ